MFINKGMNQLVMIDLYNQILGKKGMNCWYTEQHKRISSRPCWMKEAQWKRVYTEWFHLYKTLGNANQSIVTESRSVSGGGRENEGV